MICQKDCIADAGKAKLCQLAASRDNGMPPMSRRTETFNNDTIPIVDEAMNTHHVFLDTQAYRSFRHNPLSPQLNVLTQLVQDRRIELHITDITLAEVERQIPEMVSEDAAIIKKALKSFNRWKNRTPISVQLDLPSFDQDAVAAEAIKIFNQAVMGTWQATYHLAMLFPTVEIFKQYFSRQPPFVAGAKEFPDAFVAATLEKWCIDNDTAMYVITEDKAFANAAMKSKVLKPILKLDELLKLISIMDSPDIIGRVEKILNKDYMKSDLRRLAAGMIDVFGITYVGDRYSDGEVTDIKIIGEPYIDSYGVVFVSEEQIRLLIDFKSSVSVDINFVDHSHAIYDKEDDIYIGVEARDTTIENEIKFRAIATIPSKKGASIELEPITEDIIVRDPEDEWEDTW